MSNAADIVMNFVRDAQRGGIPHTPFRTLVSCLGEIEDNIELWYADGTDVEGFRDTVIRYKIQISAAFEDDFTKANDLKSITIERSDQTVMSWISEKLSDSAFRMDTPTHSKIRELLDAASTAVRDDESLPMSLRLFIIRVVRETKVALDEYDLTGDFDLTEAIVRLTGAVSMAKNQSSHPEVWKRVRDQYLFPATVGITASLPPAVIEVAKILAIGS